MFESLGLFRGVQCPLGSGCQLLDCIFAHQSETQVENVPGLMGRPIHHDAHTTGGNATDYRPSKRQRIEDSIQTLAASLEPKTRIIGADNSDGNLRLGHDASKATNIPSDRVRDGDDSSPSSESQSTPASILKRVSPPPLRKQPQFVTKVIHNDPPSTGSATTTGSSKRKLVEPKRESLNPRLVAKSPVAHALRLKLLTMIHEQMQRLNQELVNSEVIWKEALELSIQELITAALDDEERTAKENASVYSNVMKLRLLALKKMSLGTWVEERKIQIAKDNPPLAPLPSKSVEIDTGLTAREEIALLPNFVASQEGLAEHGYVVSPVTEAEIDQARKGVESAQGWEACDRCSTRFQVFPGRREDDGALTSGGKCSYHHGKKRRPAKQAGGVQRDMQYLCCSREIGTPGCVSADSHVFKVSEAKRLAQILQFEKTPKAGPYVADTAVCFDCEMGYTTLGMELVRLTATSWPDGKELLDVLVRPMGEILDLNSRFSGVWPKDFTSAVPLEHHRANNEPLPDGQLQIASSPSAARDLLFKHLTTTTPLMGHAIENDLNSARIIHPTIVDTVLLFPHPRGLPIRHGLKMLVKKFLDKDIQMGGEQGHDSKEDARGAGDLIRFKVAEHWKKMKREGWTVADGVFNPPAVGAAVNPDSIPLD